MPALPTGPSTLRQINAYLNANKTGKEPIDLLALSHRALDIWQFRPTSHDNEDIASVVVGYPKPAWQKIHQGTQPSAGEIAQVKFVTGTIESLSNVDPRVVGDVDAYRAFVASIHTEAVAQMAVNAMWYERESNNSAGINGISSFYSSAVEATSASAKNVINAGGTGADCSSIWLLRMGGLRGVTGLYPKGTEAGFRVIKGTEQYIPDPNNSARQMPAILDRYQMNVGVAVPDWRQNGRIANLKVSNFGGATYDLSSLMDQLLSKVAPPAAGVSEYWFMPGKTQTELIRQQNVNARSGAGGSLSWKEMTQWTRVMTFQGIPIITHDDPVFLAETAIT